MQNSVDLKRENYTRVVKAIFLERVLSTSILDIMKVVNTSKGGLYNHFKSKDDLFLAVLSEARKVWRQRNLMGLEEIEKPVEKVIKLLTNYRDNYLTDKETFPGGCIFVTLSMELDDQRPDFSQEITEGFKRLKAMIKRYLDQEKIPGN